MPLETIAHGGRDAFYGGEVAAEIDRFLHANGGFISREDLAAHHSDWVEPISIRYRDVELHEIGPNGQGIAALMALGMLEHFDLKSMDPDSALAMHLKIEAMKLASAYGQRRAASIQRGVSDV